MKYSSYGIKFKLFALVHVIILCVYLVYMQGYRQANALASRVFLHQGQNKRAGLPGVTRVAISLRQDEAELRVLPEKAWKTHSDA